jgi:cation:H+ antiporter
MSVLVLELFCMLALILIASMLFTNALEHLGHRLNISAGLTGSIFAAVATALPETMVPIIAIVAGTANQTVNEEVSVGAILGAPLMLSTLSTFLMAVSVVKIRGFTGRVMPEVSGFTRDMNFFLVAFSLAAIAMYVPIEPVYWRGAISMLLVGIYVFYILCTCKASNALVREGHGVIVDDSMFLTRLGMKDTLPAIYLQLILGLILLLIGAKGFISGVEHLSNLLAVSVLLISLIIIPLATELPEKVNSILWVRKNKDTLGFGNITGAMVFQGTLLPALGILLTPWAPSREVTMGLIITYMAAIWLRINASTSGLALYALFINGFLYAVYLVLALH